MARTPQITRTITTTKANFLCVDVEAGEPLNKVYELPRTYKDEKALLKAVEPMLDAGIRAVAVVDTEIVETLYGMSEARFIELAEKLPERK